MNGLEDRLRSALHDLAGRSPQRPPAPQQLLREHRRRTLRRRSAAVASVSVVGVAAGVGVTAVIPAGSAGSRQTVKVVGPAAAVPTASTSASTTPAPTRRAAVPGCPDTSRMAQQDPVLAAICLPDPAPGFPLRRATDSTDMTSFNTRATALTRTFLVGVTPPVVTTYGGGSYGATPTGAEATVMVARAGAFPTTPEGVHAEGVYPVIGTTQARGVTATVVQSDKQQIGVLVTVDGFAIAAYGENTADPQQPVTADQLIALINSLENIPSGG